VNLARVVLSLSAAAVAIAAGIVASACADDPPAEPRLLVLDGIEFRLTDVDPYIAFLDSYVPEGGRKTKIQHVLEEVLIPLRLAQRAFPAERKALQERADALRSVATNVMELEQQTAVVKEKHRSEVTRKHVQMPVAMWAFDQLKVGAVSDPIEVPEGWFVVGLFNFTESPALAVSDYVDLLQVGFIHHNRTQMLQWYLEQKQLLADKATFIHPDYATAIPAWIRPKKQP
jgi:hypothetical protein